MLLYLDNCCFNRPYDDQQQLKISLETQAKLYVQQEILSGRFTLAWSYILEHENNKNPFEPHRDSIFEWKNMASKTIYESEEILTFGETLMKRGVKLFDALHVACACIGGCEHFLTVDKHLLNKAINEIHVCNPIDFVRELED
jgi:predicted nucleic-acid-binding protein